MSVSAKGKATSRAPVPTSTFSRVLVGVDGSDEAIEAARQAALLGDGPVTLLAAYETVSRIIGATGTRVPAYLDEDLQRANASDGLERTLQALGERSDVAGKIVHGCPWDELIREIERSRDTIVVVGSHGIGRARGILVGSSRAARPASLGASSSVWMARRNRPVPTRSHGTSRRASVHTSDRSSITAASLST